jgi:putative transposase
MTQIAVKYRLYPNKNQATLINKIFGCTRKVYNLMLQEKIKYYKKNKKTLYTAPAKYKNEYEYLKEVDSLALANTQLNLEKAYNNFFRNVKKGNNKGFPKFKNKHQKQTYTTNNQKGSIEIKGNKIKLPKLKWIKIKNHRQFSGKIKSATISKSRSNKYYVSVLFETNNIKILPKTNRAIGLDFGVKSFITVSNGEKHTVSKDKKLEFCIKRAKKKLSRKLEKAKVDKRITYNKKTKHWDNLESQKNYRKQKVKVAKLQEKKANKVNDFQHKLSYELIKDNDIIVIEDLKIREMLINDKDKKSNIQKHRINEKYYFLGINDFINKLKYKADWYGKNVVTIAKDYPSSQICSKCGEQLAEPLKLTTRIFRCQSCRFKEDRDLNASKNILNEANRTVGNTGLALNISETADGCVKFAEFVGSTHLNCPKA